MHNGTILEYSAVLGGTGCSPHQEREILGSDFAYANHALISRKIALHFYRKERILTYPAASRRNSLLMGKTHSNCQHDISYN